MIKRAIRHIRPPANRLFVILVCVGYMPNAAAQSTTAESTGEAKCGGVIVRVRDEQAEPVKYASRPFNIQANLDAIAIGTKVEPFNIESCCDRNMKIRINGGASFTVLLTAGPSRKADDVVDDLNDNATFASQADAYTVQGRVMVRSARAASGTIEFLPMAFTAYNELGFAEYFVYGPTIDSDVLSLINEVADEYEGFIEATSVLPDPYHIGFALYGAGSAAWGGIAYTDINSLGHPVGSQIAINISKSWFIDPTPGLDEEFEALPDRPGESVCPDLPCLGTVDMLTVLRHEVAHALGYTGMSSSPMLDLFSANRSQLSQGLDLTDLAMTVANGSAFVPSDGIVLVGNELIEYESNISGVLFPLTRGVNDTSPANHASGAVVTSGNTFDRSRLNVGVENFGSHASKVVHPGDIMGASLSASIRHGITRYPTIALLARAHDYDVDMEFLDSNYNSGSEDGSANRPWNTYNEALWCPKKHLLMVPGNYVESGPSITVLVPCEYESARGGAVSISVSGSQARR